ncbi:MAG: right-handed parallel beta-helix repeat-containing protein [Terracidiphilus sp.]
MIDSNRSGTFYFAPGVYRLHNQGVNRPGLTLRNFSGTIIMAKGAQFACDTEDTQAGQCIWVVQSHGANFKDLTITYKDPQLLPMPRASATSNALLVEDSHHIDFLNTTIFGSTGSGIWSTNSTGITFEGTTTVSNTTADGIHFENVGAGSLASLITNSTGDDAIGVTNIAASNPNCGLTVAQAQITNSRSRGIAAVGACDAQFLNIVIDGTANSAIASVNDLAINSRNSTNIKFTNVVANGVGTVNSVIKGNGYCVDVNHSSHVSVLNVTCSGSRDDGVFVYDGADTVAIQKVVLKQPGNNGFQTSRATNVTFADDQVTRARNNGFDIEASTNVTLQNCQTTDAGGYGFFHSRSAHVLEFNLLAKNSATTSGNHRAWWAESISGPVTVDGVSVIDDRRPALGYVVGDYDLTGHALTVNGLIFQIAHGAGSIQKSESSASYSAHDNQGTR